MKDEFRRIARLTIDQAIEVYRYRGKANERTVSSLSFPWSTSIQHGVYHYSINRNHPLVSDILQNAGPARSKIQALLKLVEETVPVPLIVLNSSNNPDKIQRPFGETPPEEMRRVLEEIWNSLINTGVSREDAKIRLNHMEPFSDYPQFVVEFIKKKNEDVE